jgi:hypothetical protein
MADLSYIEPHSVDNNNTADEYALGLKVRDEDTGSASATDEDVSSSHSPLHVTVQAALLRSWQLHNLICKSCMQVLLKHKDVPIEAEGKGIEWDVLVWQYSRGKSPYTQKSQCPVCGLNNTAKMRSCKSDSYSLLSSSRSIVPFITDTWTAKGKRFVTEGTPCMKYTKTIYYRHFTRSASGPEPGPH